MEIRAFSFLSFGRDDSGSNHRFMPLHLFEQAKDFLSIDVSYGFFGRYASNDPDVLSKRYSLMRDMLSNIEDFERFFATSIELLEELCVIDVIKIKVSPGIEDQLLHSKILTSYVLWIEKSHEMLLQMHEKGCLKSEAMLAYFAIIRGEYESAEFKKLAKNTRNLQASVSNIKSITLGLNLNPDFSVREAGILSIGQEPIQSGKLIDRILRGDLLRMAELQALMPLVKIPHSLKQQELIAFNQAVHDALGNIFKKSIGNWSHQISKLYTEKASQYTKLLPELQYLHKCLLFAKRMREVKASVCLPQVASSSPSGCHVEGMYLPTLLSGAESRLVHNDIDLMQGEIHLLYGPNHGGKTKLLQCILNIYMLFHLGAPIPAANATIAPVTGLIYYSVDHKAINGNAESRLLCELKEIKHMFDSLKGGELVLCDEMFSSTQEVEGSRLAIEVIRAFSTYHVYVLYSTHLHELCKTLAQTVANVNMLHMGIADGAPTYHLELGAGPSHSYAKQLAEKNGVTFEALRKKDTVQNDASSDSV